MSLYTELPGFSPVQQTTKKLTAAQILNLTASPVSLVKGVPGRIIVPLLYILKYKFGTTPYTTLSGGFSSNFNVFPGANPGYAWDQGARAADVIGEHVTAASDNIIPCASMPPQQQFAALGSNQPTVYLGQDLSFGFGDAQVFQPTGGDGTIEIDLVYMVI